MCLDQNRIDVKYKLIYSSSNGLLIYFYSYSEFEFSVSEFGYFEYFDFRVNKEFGFEPTFLFS